MLMHSCCCTVIYVTLGFVQIKSEFKNQLKMKFKIALKNGKGILLYSLPHPGFRPAGPTSNTSLFPLLCPVAMAARSLPLLLLRAVRAVCLRPAHAEPQHPSPFA
jgi:hypothetical protein